MSLLQESQDQIALVMVEIQRNIRNKDDQISNLNLELQSFKEENERLNTKLAVKHNNLLEFFVGFLSILNCARQSAAS